LDLARQLPVLGRPPEPQPKHLALEDIAHEEREILTSNVIREDSIVIDQCGG
jgi:hypothetical protein